MPKEQDLLSILALLCDSMKDMESVMILNGSSDNPYFLRAANRRRAAQKALLELCDNQGGQRQDG